jgi:hypothetical protein
MMKSTSAQMAQEIALAAGDIEQPRTDESPKPVIVMTFDEFYTQEYLARHADRLCRAFHIAGFLASAVLLGIVLWLETWWLLLSVPLPTFLLGWIGHLSVGNQPTFFQHPLWSIRAFGKMFGAMLKINKKNKGAAGLES